MTANEIQEIVDELIAACEARGWQIERSGMSNSTTSRYFTVRKPTGLVNSFGSAMTIDIDVRVADHDNLSATSYHANPLLNLAPGAAGYSVEEVLCKLDRARIVDEAEAIDDDEIRTENVTFKK